jgi:hypothetical protein
MAAEGSNISGPPYSGPAVKPILDSVTYPSDMKRLDMRQLKQVRRKVGQLLNCISFFLGGAWRQRL